MIGRSLNPLDAPAPDDPAVGIDLTPMIDVTFLLIIFWLVVTSIAPSQPVRQLELPVASVRQSAGGGRPIMLDVTAEPVRPIYWLGQAFSPAELDGRFSARPPGGRDIVLRADRRSDAALVAALARLCYRHGARSVSFSLRAVGAGPTAPPAGGRP